MKYFLHDTNSFDDEKVTELFLQFGYEGLGLFYTCLEKLAKQEKPVKTNVLKAQLKVGKRLEKCWKFMEEIGIISSSNGETFNKQLLNFSEKYQIKKEKNRDKVSEWRKRQDDTENVTSYTPECNARKVKESKVNKSKVNILKSEFDYFRTKYPGTKRGLEIEFTNMVKKHSDAENVIPILLIALENQIEIRNRKKSLGGFIPEWKNLSTWINQRCWEEEISLNVNTPKSEMDELKDKLNKLRAI